MLPVPRYDYPACETRPVKANPYSQIVFDTNRYSVPHGYAGKQLMLRAFPFRIEVLCLEDIIASHPRCFGREQDIYNPMHYLSLLEQRPGAFEHAKPMRYWRKKWPPGYEQLLNSLKESKPQGQGVREFIAILKLHQTYSAELVEDAVSAAIQSGLLSLDGVIYHLHKLTNTPHPIQPLDLSRHPTLADFGHQPLDLRVYDRLLEVQ